MTNDPLFLYLLYFPLTLISLGFSWFWLRGKMAWQTETPFEWTYRQVQYLFCRWLYGHHITDGDVCVHCGRPEEKEN